MYKYDINSSVSWWPHPLCFPDDAHERALSRASMRSGHAHHHTHPLSSRASSVFGVRVKSPTGEEDGEEGRAISPTIPRPVSPMD